ncbi:MAG: DNA-directed RNA polymerase subunit beta [Bacteroidetes bacterium]|nr:DNA-directed RNA polymerase subunit beta [Bacteroidota bacterium]MCY4233085.1 DNA-directed RNA polymerase subunit beta [Bacteroidota bacterium]
MSSKNGQHADRVNFARYQHVLDYPDFLAIQLESFEEFVQSKLPPDQRSVETGLQQIFLSHFPIEDAKGRYILEFIDYSLGGPKHSIEECLAQGLNYSIPLKATLRLSAKDDEDDDEAEESVEQEVYLGDLPAMTDSGSFVINGAERVVVSQLHRSPGVFFDQKMHPNGTPLFSARIIPFRGSWIEFTTDVQNVMWAYIDRKRKLTVTTLLRAMGYGETDEIVRLFDLAKPVNVHTKKSFKTSVGSRLAFNVTQKVTPERVFDEDTNELAGYKELETGFKIDYLTRDVNTQETGDVTEIYDKQTGEMIEHIDKETGDKVDYINQETGEIVVETLNRIILPAEHSIVLDDWKPLHDYKIDRIYVLHEEEDDSLDTSTLVNTIRRDPSSNQAEALEHLYKALRDTEPPDSEATKNILDRLIFSEKRYDLGAVGRYRINTRLGLNVPPETVTLTHDDIICIIRKILVLRTEQSGLDDIDHLSNRRVRTVGEQLAVQFSTGLSRMARTIRERMNARDADSLTPQDLVNSKTIVGVINTFFGTNQLSQYMDQTNPLAELTHKRRMSALGPGGLTRERAGFEVRDVHYTHYGRLCPIETPEGPNIGLISSLCVHGRINHFGFIETPYRRVVDGQVTDSIVYLSAEEEDEAIIAQANSEIDEKGHFINNLIRCRHRGEFPSERPEKIQFMDISPNQIVSPSASIIPFLEHDDANRALMGSNMQRQAVPLLQAEAPIVGTGMEGRVARDSRAAILAEGNGLVEYVDANRIVVRYQQSVVERKVSFEDPLKEYKLTKFRRTNQDTCINQKPIVKIGQKVKEGTVLSDGFATQNGELALGKNVLVAFMPWRGYNFEDAIVLSERLVTDDVFTSIHIESFDLQVRETKRGQEELTREIPNVSIEATKDLDETGIVRVGAEVKAGDIIVGKITPKGETDPTPEEKLLRAIFGDKAGDVKDASLKAPPGMNGVVIDTQLYSRRSSDPESKKREHQLLAEIENTFEKDLDKLNQDFTQKFFDLTQGCIAAVDIESKDGEIVISEGAEILQSEFTDVQPYELNPNFSVKGRRATNNNLKELFHNYTRAFDLIDDTAKRERHLAQMGDELSPGIVQLAKVYIAKKRKIQVGDKMAGRHGNKGVVARIVPVEDMPFLEDGTPVDIILNPLGVPSRMNLGQIYETLLGWAGQILGKRFSTPSFDGPTMDDLTKNMEAAGLSVDGRTQLYDGLTGEPFDQKTTVGQIYMMKLSHLVDDKIHARSIGPYSLITQQPLGGKAQFGGQRLGEMEVWAMYAYGASHVLQEMLTFKSDDVQGRSKAYECIVKGENMPSAGIPESFNVLVRELQGLGLEVVLD